MLTLAMLNPAILHPSYADSAILHPGYADPGYADPGYTDPDYSDPAMLALPLTLLVTQVTVFYRLLHLWFFKFDTHPITAAHSVT